MHRGKVWKKIKEEALDLGIEALSDGRPTTKFNN
jgi:hypothetical protein